MMLCEVPSMRLWWLLEAGRSVLAGKGLLPPRSRGWVAPEPSLSPTRWHWEPCYGVPIAPATQPGQPLHPSGASAAPMALLDLEQLHTISFPRGAGLSFKS